MRNGRNVGRRGAPRQVMPGAGVERLRAFGGPARPASLRAMRYGGAEDRLNPVTPPGVDDTTLGGYLAVHGRAAAFQGVDGEPYTVAVETDRGEDPDAPWTAYLVFVRWAQTGTAVMGHLETGDLVAAATEEEARARLDALPLPEVRVILDETIRRRRADPETPAAG